MIIKKSLACKLSSGERGGTFRSLRCGHANKRIRNVLQVNSDYEQHQLKKVNGLIMQVHYYAIKLLDTRARIFLALQGLFTLVTTTMADDDEQEEKRQVIEQIENFRQYILFVVQLIHPKSMHYSLIFFIVVLFIVLLDLFENRGTGSVWTRRCGQLQIDVVLLIAFVFTDAQMQCYKQRPICLSDILIAQSRNFLHLTQQWIR